MRDVSAPGGRPGIPDARRRHPRNWGPPALALASSAGRSASAQDGYALNGWPGHRGQASRYPRSAVAPAFVLIASITDPLVELATRIVGDLGLAGIFVLMLLESACIPIPSEATMLFAGFNVHNGQYTLLAVTLAGTLGNLMGSWLAYAVGYFGRVDLLETHGRKIGIRTEHLARADRWF